MFGDGDEERWMERTRKMAGSRNCGVSNEN
jgi:hypothetical protein